MGTHADERWGGGHGDRRLPLQAGPVWSRAQERRLDAFLAEALAFLKLKRAGDASFTYEVIVVDDGSADGTYAAALKYTSRLGLDVFRVLRLPVNKGKGAAVRAGVLAARGELLLIADADGATTFCELDRLLARMDSVAAAGPGGSAKPSERSVFSSIGDCHGFVAGSRAHLERDAKVTQRSWVRNLAMHGFHLAVLLAVGRTLRDTQCGFKVRVGTSLSLEILGRQG